MKLYFSIIFYCTAAFRSSNCATEFDLKIEHNEAQDKQTSLNKLHIAFKNIINSNTTAVINKRFPNGKIVAIDNFKHFKPRSIETNHIHARLDRDSDDRHLYTTEHVIETFKAVNEYGENRAPFIQSQSNDVKQKLTDYTMAKRNSHYVTPAFEFPDYSELFVKGIVPQRLNTPQSLQEDVVDFLDTNDLQENGYSFPNTSYIHLKVFKDIHKNSKHDSLKNNDVKINKMLNNANTRTINKAVSERNSENFIRNNVAKPHPQTLKINRKIRENNDALSLFGNPKLLKLLKKQTTLIEQLENHLRYEKLANLRTDFDDLIESMENKQNKTTTHNEQERITDKTEATTRLSTVTQLIDETSIRKALKNDPFVQRILKMANEKRKEYEKQAKKYYGNLLYH